MASGENQPPQNIPRQTSGKDGNGRKVYPNPALFAQGQVRATNEGGIELRMGRLD